MEPILSDPKLLELEAGQRPPTHFSTKLLWHYLAPKLLNFVNITALLIAAGFFVIQSFLASFAQAFTFNISISQYLMAGVNMVLALVWNLVMPILLAGFLASLAIVALSLLGRFFHNRSKRVHNLWRRLADFIHPLYLRWRPKLRRLWAIYQIVVGALFILLIIMVAFVYGRTYYAQSPRMFGGGMPINVILVFSEEQPTQNSIWGFAINPSNARQSEVVQLLMELTDGVIVRDVATDTTTIVKNDTLQGIIYATSLSNNIMIATTTPTPPTPSSTP